MNLFYKASRFMGIALMVCMLLALSACGGDNPSQQGKASPQSEQTQIPAQPTSTGVKTPQDNGAVIDNTASLITPLVQEYEGDNIFEIMMISYDGSQPVLDEFGHKNPEIESFNSAVKFGVYQQYLDFTDQNDGESWMEIRSYPFTDERYLQVVTTSAIYPSYGTDGELSSYNFDRQQNRFLSIYEALEQLGKSEDEMVQTIAEKLDASLAHQGSVATAGEVVLSGFLYTSSPAGQLTQLLATVEVMTDGDAWKTFYAYTPQLDELLQMNSQCLFDPSEMDQMEPPLAYQQQPQMPGEGLAIVFDTEGLDVLTPDQEYMLDGLVYFKTDQTEVAQYGEDAVVASIEGMEGAPIRLISVEQWSELSEALTYPCWRVAYEKGEAEDTAHCVDLYVQTDAADYRLHTSTPIDYWEQYQDEVAYRISFVSLGQ